MTSNNDKQDVVKALMLSMPTLDDYGSDESGIERTVSNTEDDAKAFVRVLMQARLSRDTKVMLDEMEDALSFDPFSQTASARLRDNQPHPSVPTSDSVPTGDVDKSQSYWADGSPVAEKDPTEESDG